MEENRFDAVEAILDKGSQGIVRDSSGRIDPYVSFARRIAKLESAMAALRASGAPTPTGDTEAIEAHLRDVSLTQVEINDRLDIIESRLRRL